jgi:hypothetical protein
MDTFVDELRKRRARAREGLASLYAGREELDRQIRDQEAVVTHIDALLAAEGVALEPAVAQSFGLDAVLDWSKLSVQECIRRLLAETGRAMHADEIRKILEERGKAFSREDPKATIVTALIRGARRGLYVRTAPNTFRLTAAGGGEAGE